MITLDTNCLFWVGFFRESSADISSPKMLKNRERKSCKKRGENSTVCGNRFILGLKVAVMYPYQESDLDFRFRKPAFYPLNYGDRIDRLSYTTAVKVRDEGVEPTTSRSRTVRSTNWASPCLRPSGYGRQAWQAHKDRIIISNLAGKCCGGWMIYKEIYWVYLLTWWSIVDVLSYIDL